MLFLLLPQNKAQATSSLASDRYITLDAPVQLNARHGGARRFL